MLKSKRKYRREVKAVLSRADETAGEMMVQTMHKNCFLALITRMIHYQWLVSGIPKDLYEQKIHFLSLNQHLRLETITSDVRVKLSISMFS